MISVTLASSPSLRTSVLKTFRYATQMARHWTEPLNSERHRDFMSSTNVGGLAADSARTGSSVVFFVAVTGFTFQFANLGQLRECLEWFRVKVHPSSRESGHDLEHYWQRWHERLPKGITKEPKRQKIVKALENALADFTVGKQSKAGG